MKDSLKKSFPNSLEGELANLSPEWLRSWKENFNQHSHTFCWTFTLRRCLTVYPQQASRRIYDIFLLLNTYRCRMWITRSHQLRWLFEINFLSVSHMKIHTEFSIKCSALISIGGLHAETQMRIGKFMYCPCISASYSTQTWGTRPWAV